MIRPSKPSRAFRALFFPVSCLVAVASAAACGSTGKGSSGDASTPDDAASWPHDDATVGDGASASDGSPTSDGSTADAADGAASDASDGATGDGAAADASDGATGDSAAADASDAAVRIDDPFDARSCDGPAISAADALVLLGATPRAKLADATLLRRERTCTGADVATCGAWGAPVPHTQALLTYSGGVVTDYKTFAFPTHLVLFAQGGQPRFSVRHTSDYVHDATASTRGVQFSFGASPMVNTYPVIYVWDFAPAPNRYEDLAGLLGSQAELHASATCARLRVTSGNTREIAALYRF